MHVNNRRFRVRSNYDSRFWILGVANAGLIRRTCWRDEYLLQRINSHSLTFWGSTQHYFIKTLSILNEINRTHCRSRIWGWGGQGCRCRAAGPDPGSRTCQHSWKFRYGNCTIVACNFTNLYIHSLVGLQLKYKLTQHILGLGWIPKKLST